MHLVVLSLDPSVDRMVVPLGEPEQPIAAAVFLFAVAEIEQLARGTGRVESEYAGIAKPDRTAELEIIAERRLQAVNEIDSILRGVMPITRPFGPTAIRPILVKTERYRSVLTSMGLMAVGPKGRVIGITQRNMLSISLTA